MLVWNSPHETMATRDQENLSPRQLPIWSPSRRTRKPARRGTTLSKQDTGPGPRSFCTASSHVPQKGFVLFVVRARGNAPTPPCERPAPGFVLFYWVVRTFSTGRPQPGQSQRTIIP